MKAKITLLVFLIVSADLSFVTSISLAGGIFSDWAYAVNNGNVPVILHIKTGEDKYSEIQLEPGKSIVLPAGSIKVTAFPAKGYLEKTDRMEVVANLITEGYGDIITEPGKSVKFPRPSIAVTPEMRKQMRDDVTFAPGALAPAEEVKEAAKEEAPIDDKEFLRKQNDMYIEEKNRLNEIEPDSAEAGVIGSALKNWGENIDRMTKEAEAKYGPDWREQYRDSNGKLPGGFIEDDKSRLIKLQEKRKEQQDKVDGLKSELEELTKQVKPVESRWEDRLAKDQQEFREKFIKEHGSPDTWNEETRKQYKEGFDDSSDKSKEQWEKDKAEQSDINKAIGKKIKEIADEQAELNQMNKVIEQQDKRLNEKPSAGPAIPAEPNETVSYLLSAFDEIDSMIREVEQARVKHYATLEGGRFMKCYYTKRTDIPESELGKSVYIITGEGWPADYPQWLWIPGLSIIMTGETIAGTLRPYTITCKLENSFRFLRDNADYYRKHPPIREMNYLRDGMDKWRRAFIEYHNAMDIYYEKLAEYTKYNRYFRSIYESKIKELDMKYAGRENNGVLWAKYDVERKELEDWWKEIERIKDAVGEEIYSGAVAQRVDKAQKVELFNGLDEEFSGAIKICKKNEEYIQLQERLQDKKLDKETRKQLKDESLRLEEEISKFIKDEEKSHGKNWMDRCRDPITGALPGGLVCDHGLTALKTMYNTRKGKMVFAVGEAQPTASKKEALPQDNLYTFLASCMGTEGVSGEKAQSLNRGL
jgi:hypothetical protein